MIVLLGLGGVDRVPAELGGELLRLEEVSFGLELVFAEDVLLFFVFLTGPQHHPLI